MELSRFFLICSNILPPSVCLFQYWIVPLSSFSSDFPVYYLKMSILNGTYEGGLTHQFPNGSYIGNVTLILNPHLCTLQTCDLSMSSFEYRPTVAGNAIYAAIFGISILAQLYLGIKHKTWGYMVAMLFGLVCRSSSLPPFTLPTLLPFTQLLLFTQADPILLQVSRSPWLHSPHSHPRDAL